MPQRGGSKHSPELLLNLLQRYCTVPETQSFLAARNLSYSAPNWADLLANRIRPSLEDGSLPLLDLIGLLRDAEEHGNQHVFLFSCTVDSARSLLDRRRTVTALKAANLLKILEQPSIVDMPAARRLVEARWESSGAFILKSVGTRIHRHRVDEQREGTRVTVIYDEEPYRAVDVFKLHHHGMLELRIQSHKNTSRYEHDISEMWDLAGAVMPRSEFEPVSILNAKNWLWTHHAELKEKIRFTGMRLRNDRDFKLTAAAPTLSDDLTSDDGTVEGTAGFLRHHRAYCDQSNCYFINAEGSPPRDIHVILSGLAHEFCLTAACSRAGYEYVLTELRKYNS